jgi:prepilin-type N-terminal cleavage/methylation domain-containing protein/prepilin-type processing-associated H-X9-DG protein
VVRRRGFTLIELLVVIAIIAILAAMLFPVFARARESARKIQCLANVKNIAIAFQMYLTDFDRMPPSEHSSAVNEYLVGNCGEASCDSRLACRGTSWNPYLRLPVIMDEYVKNRDVWRCSSAKYSSNTVAINWAQPDWLTYAIASYEGDSCPKMKLCNNIYPPGWGGNVTDTTLQGECGLGNGAFDQSLATPAHNRDLKMSQIDDVTKRVVVGDGGIDLEPWRTSGFSYPDYSRFDQLLVGCGGNCSTEDCGNASVAETCSPLSLCFGGDGKFGLDTNYRKTFARHMGGSNLGFADGHAGWFDAEKILFGGWNNSGYATEPLVFDGLEMCFFPVKQ